MYYEVSTEMARTRDTSLFKYLESNPAIRDAIGKFVGSAHHYLSSYDDITSGHVVQHHYM